MRTRDGFLREVVAIALPVTLQSMLQSSFCVVDQIMIGQLTGVSVAAVGLAGKFTSIYSVIAAAIGTVAGIMLSQYIGQKKSAEVRRSFRVNLWLALLLAALFTAAALALPSQLMRLYVTDEETVRVAASYLRIVSLTFFPVAVTTMLSALLRCTNRAKLPLYAALAAAVCNTAGNYALIFGHFGLPMLGVQGAAIATAASQGVNLALLLLLTLCGRKETRRAHTACEEKFNVRQYCTILLPVLGCEFLWSLGENVYAAIYGHIGTAACAAMTLTNPIQSLMIGALSGLSQAAGVLIGTRLGAGEMQRAYDESKRLVRYGLAGALALSVVLLASRTAYTRIYQVDEATRTMTAQLLAAYAVIAPVKVLNMILGGGVLRSGGRTELVMWIDLIGTWVFGVPLGLMAAFWWKLPIAWVYFVLSMEECVRLAMEGWVFRSRRWMRRLGSGEIQRENV